MRPTKPCAGGLVPEMIVTAIVRGAVLFGTPIRVPTVLTIQDRVAPAGPVLGNTALDLPPVGVFLGVTYRADAVDGPADICPITLPAEVEAEQVSPQ